MSDINVRAAGQTTDGLDFLWMDITERCNLECVHCYSESGPNARRTGRMQTSDWERVMDESLALGCQKVQFIGGEPITHPEFKRLLKYTCTRFYFIEVFSNLTALPNDILAIMKDYGVRLATSVYSHDESRHEAITQRKSSFSSTIGNLRIVIRESIPVRVAIIAMKPNEKNVEETQTFLKSLGVNDIGVDYAREIGRGKGEKEKKDSIDALCGRCWQGRLTVNSDGNAYPCVMSKFMPVGNVLVEGLQSIVLGERLQNNRKKVKNHHENNIIRANCEPWTTCQPKGGCPPVDPCYPSCLPSRFHSPIKEVTNQSKFT